MAKFRGRCIFCGSDGDLTKEDPIPHWLDRLLRDMTPVAAVQVQSALTDSSSVLRYRSRKMGGVSAYKLPVVCGSCNSVWMRDIENEAKDRLEPLIRNSRRGLLPADQHAIARWMVLKALTFDLIGDSEPIAGPADFTRFHDECDPPPQFSAWLARYKDPPPDHLALHYLGPVMTGVAYDGRPAGTPLAQQLTLVFGHLVMQSVLVVAAAGDYPAWYRRPEPSPHLVRIWPISGTANWPPPYAIPGDALQAFAAADGPYPFVSAEGARQRS